MRNHPLPAAALSCFHGCCDMPSYFSFLLAPPLSSLLSPLSSLLSPSVFCVSVSVACRLLKPWILSANESADDPSGGGHSTVRLWGTAGLDVRPHTTNKHAKHTAHARTTKGACPHLIARGARVLCGAVSLSVSLLPVCIGVALATVSDMELNFWVRTQRRSANEQGERGKEAANGQAADSQ
jgi:hypothetical protein